MNREKIAPDGERGKRRNNAEAKKLFAANISRFSRDVAGGAATGIMRARVVSKCYLFLHLEIE